MVGRPPDGPGSLFLFAMRPLAVLILVLGAIASLLFALGAFMNSGPRGTVLTDSPNVKPALARPDKAAPPPALEVAEDLELPKERQVVSSTPEEDVAALTGVIRGTVVDIEGIGIADAVVSLIYNETPAIQNNEFLALVGGKPAKPIAQTNTDGMGAFAFNGLEPGNHWSLTASHEDYTSGSVGPVDVPSSGGVDELIKLYQGLTVFGRITDIETGLGIEGVSVTVENPLAAYLPQARQNGTSLVSTSDANGDYIIKNIGAGNQVVRLAAPGYATLIVSTFSNDLRSRAASAKVPDVYPTKRSKIVELENQPDEPIQWDFELAPGQVIAGVVVGPDRQGIAGVKVNATNMSGSMGSVGETLTADNGEFLIEDLGEGVYSLQTEAEGYQSTPLQRVDVGRTDVEIVLVRQGGVSGTVVDGATGRAARNFRIRVRTLHPQNVAWGAVMAKRNVRDRSDGAFQVGGLSEGEYVVEAYANGYASSFSEPFRIDSGLTTGDVVVHLTKGGTLRGRVLDHYSKEPVVGATVSTRDNNWIDSEIFAMFEEMGPGATTKTSVTTNSAGDFELELLTPDLYQLRIEKPGFSPVVMNDIRVDNGPPTEVGEFELKRGAIVEGVVLDNEGYPVPGANVSMQPTDANVFMSYSVRSDANGRYSIRNSREGEYNLSATRPNTPRSSPFAPIVDIQHSEITITVLDGGKYDHDLHLPARAD